MGEGLLYDTGSMICFSIVLLYKRLLDSSIVYSRVNYAFVMYMILFSRYEDSYIYILVFKLKGET
jgi:hypothetical protein